METRYFYAPAIFAPHPTVYVLTTNRSLYTEIKISSEIQKLKIQVKSFIYFNPKDYETDDQPVILEITRNEAIEISEGLDHDWVGRYLDEKQTALNQSFYV